MANSANQEVKTTFDGKDFLSKVFRKMARQSKLFNKGVERDFKRASRSALKFDKITKGILKASVIQGTLSGASQAAVQVTQDFAAFDDSILSAASKFKGLNLATAEGRKQLTLLEKAARKTGAETQFNAVEAAKGLDFLALAGFDATQSIAALPGLADLATAANMEDLGEAVDIASDSLGAFGLMTKDAIQLQTNLGRVSDVFAKTQASTNTTLIDLFESVKKGAAQFTAAGQSIETFSALAGEMANAGVKGSESGTQLRNIMLRLASPTTKASGLLKKLGVQVKDSDGNFRDVIDILADFEKGLKGMGDVQRSAALSTIFGARSVTGLNILLKAGTKRLRSFRGELKNSKGASKEMADIMRSSLGNQFKSLQSAATELGFKFLEAFKKDGAGGLAALTEGIRNFDPQPIIDGMKEVFEITKLFFSLTKDLLPLIGLVTSFFLIKKTALVALTAAFLAYNAITKGLAITMKILTAVQWAYNVALTANPIGAIIVGVVALIAALVLLIANWDKVKKFIVDGAMKIVSIFGKIWELITRITSGIGKIAGKAFNFIFGGSPEQPSPTAVFAEGQAPPLAEASSQAQQARFEGIFKFENKPDNVSFSAKSTNAPGIDISTLGVN